MADNLILIPEVSKGLAHWTVKVTITEELPSFISSRTGTQYKRYVLTDDAGNTIPAVVYGRQIATLAKTLRLHGVYHISNASIKVPIGQPTSTNYLHWVLQSDTLIHTLQDEAPTLRYFLDSITPLSMLGSFANREDSTVDVMVVVIKAGEPEPITTKLGLGTIQRFTLVAAERIPVILSLWDQQVTKSGPTLTAAAASFSVLVAKRLIANIYRGVALSSYNGSSFTIDPPLPEATALKTWFESIRATELPHLLDDYSGTLAKDLVDRGIVKKHSVLEIQSSQQCGDFWTRAFLKLSETDQHFHYIGCNNCFCKVNSPPNHNYHCLQCDKPAMAMIRPRVLMDLYDFSGRITVGAIESVAEKILQCTTAQLATLVQQGIPTDVESIKKEFEDKMYLALVRRSYSQHSNAQKRPLLVAYFDDTVPDDTATTELLTSHADIPAGTSNVADIVDPNSPPVLSVVASSAPSIESIGAEVRVSPLKRQLENIAIAAGSPVKKMLFTEVASSALPAPPTPLPAPPTPPIVPGCPHGSPCT